jgi:hypothetical protein
VAVAAQLEDGEPAADDGPDLGGDDGAGGVGTIRPDARL